MMFRCIEAEILDINKVSIGQTSLTLQSQYTTKRFTDKGFGNAMSIDIKYKAYCDFNNLIDKDSYLRFDNRLFKVIEPCYYPTHIKCYLYECGVE